MTRSIRFEKYNNSHIRPTNWGGNGQPTEWARDPATVWSVLVHDPDRWEGCEVHHFTNKEARQRFIDDYVKKD